MTTNDLLEYEIYPRLNASLIFGDLNGFRRTGRNYIANCPACQDTKRHFNMYSGKPYGFCYKCGYKVNYWNYIKETKKLTKQDTLKELARLSGVTLPQSHEIDTQEIERRQKKADDLEGFLEVCQEALKKSQDAQNYLKKRGFTLEEALEHNIGFYPYVDVIKASNTSIEGLLMEKWANRIIGLWRDRAGRPITVWGRGINEDIDPKYYYLYGEPKYSPYGLEKCPKDEVIAVEGILDALSLHKNGFNEAIAIGGSNITEEQIKSLVKARIKTITLNLDNDNGGIQGIDRALGRLEAEGIKTYVIEPSLMPIPEGKDKADPDDYIRTNGIEAYRSLLSKAKRGVEWKIESLIKRHDKETSKGRDVILDEAIKFMESIKDPLMLEYGNNALAIALGISIENIEKLTKDRRERTERERLEREYKDILRKAEGGEISIETLSNVIEGLKGQVAGLRIEDIGFFDMDRLYEEGKAYAQKGKETGIAELDRAVKIMPKELIIIGARVRHGKSSLAYNFLLNFLEKYEDEAFIFFNMDVPSTIVMTRLATIWAKKHKDESYAYKDMLSFFQDRDNMPKDINDAFLFFHTCGIKKRLAIINTPNYTVEQLIGHAERLAQEKPLGAIFVDYIEEIKTARKTDTEELRISHIVNSLRIASERLSTPVIALAQMNRATVKEKTPEKRRPNLEGLRYSGRQEQEATTVLGLFNVSQEKIEINQEDGIFNASDTETTLEVIPLKNRGGQSNKIIELDFDMKSGHIATRQKQGFGSYQEQYKQYK